MRVGGIQGLGFCGLGFGFSEESNLGGMIWTRVVWLSGLLKNHC